MNEGLQLVTDVLRRTFGASGDLASSFWEMFGIAILFAFALIFASGVIAVSLRYLCGRDGQKRYALAISGMLLLFSISLPIKQFTAHDYFGGEGYLTLVLAYITHLLPMYVIFWSVRFSYTSAAAVHHFVVQCGGKSFTGKLLILWRICLAHFRANIPTFILFVVFSSAYLLFDDKTILGGTFFSFGRLENTFVIVDKPLATYILPFVPVLVYVGGGLALVAIISLIFRYAETLGENASGIGSDLPAFIFTEHEEKKALRLLELFLHAAFHPKHMGRVVESGLSKILVYAPFLVALSYLLYPLVDVYIVDVGKLLDTVLTAFWKFLVVAVFISLMLMGWSMIPRYGSSREGLLLNVLFFTAMVPPKVLATFVGKILPDLESVDVFFEPKLIVTFMLTFGVFPLYFFATHIAETRALKAHLMKGLGVDKWPSFLLSLRSLQMPLLYGVAVLLLLIVGDSNVVSSLNLALPAGDSVFPAHDLYLSLKNAQKNIASILDELLVVILLTLSCIIMLPFLNFLSRSLINVVSPWKMLQGTISPRI